MNSELSLPRSPVDVVVIAGWSIPAAFMQPLLVVLQQHSPSSLQFRCISLPGIDGASLASGQKLLDWLCTRLKPETPTILVGWSFGGSLAMQLMARQAQYRLDIRGLLCLGSNPCFVQRRDWPWAITDATISEFQQQLRTKPGRLLQSFAALCTLGCKQAGRLRKSLQECWQSAAFDAQQAALCLEELALLDARPALNGLTGPCTLVFAEQDAITPFAAMAELQSQHRQTVQIRLLASPGGHAVWLEQPQSVLSHWHELTQ